MYFQEANNYGLVEVKDNNVTRLPDFNNLKSQISKVKPTGAQMSSYVPTNTKLEECPANGTAWEASSKLPPTPNKELCSCMTKSLNCVAKDDIKDKTVADLFSFICGGGIDCSGIHADGTSGEYGTYSMCSPMERLSWAMNSYYMAQSKAKTACNFSGGASLKTPAQTPECTSIIKQAGMGAAIPTSTASPGKKSSAANLPIPSFEFGAITIGAVLVAHFFGGIALAI
jgi:hypothetical protein